MLLLPLRRVGPWLPPRPPEPPTHDDRYTAYERVSTSMNDFVIASAFGDAGTKVIGFLTEVRPALIAMIIFGAALGVVFDRGHKGAILGSAVLAIILLMGFTTLGAQI